MAMIREAEVILRHGPPGAPREPVNVIQHDLLMEGERERRDDCRYRKRLFEFILGHICR